MCRRGVRSLALLSAGTGAGGGGGGPLETEGANKPSYTDALFGGGGVPVILVDTGVVEGANSGLWYGYPSLECCRARRIDKFERCCGRGERRAVGVVDGDAPWSAASPGGALSPTPFSSPSVLTPGSKSISESSIVLALISSAACCCDRGCGCAGGRERGCEEMVEWWE
jgi:hypothetical protein